MRGTPDAISAKIVPHDQISTCIIVSVSIARRTSRSATTAVKIVTFAEKQADTGLQRTKRKEISIRTAVL